MRTQDAMMMVCLRPFWRMLSYVDTWPLTSRVLLSGSALRPPRSRR